MSIANSELDPLASSPAGQATHRFVGVGGARGGGEGREGEGLAGVPASLSSTPLVAPPPQPDTSATPLHIPLHSPPCRRSAVKRFALISIITLVNEIFPSYTQIQVGGLHDQPLV